MSGERTRSSSFSWRKKKKPEAPKAEEAPLLKKEIPIEPKETIHFDLCFVFRNPDHEDGAELAKRLNEEDYEEPKEYVMTKSYKHFVSKCLHVGLTTHVYLSVQADEVYVMIGAPLKRFQDQADFADFKMLMNEAKLEEATDAYFTKISKDMNPDQFIDGQPPCLGDSDFDKKFAKTGRGRRFRKYQNIYCKYETDADQDLYDIQPPLAHPFHSTHRIKLLQMIIEGEDFRGGADINIGECLELKNEDGNEAKAGGYGLLDTFPLHDPQQVNDLYRNWVVWQQWPWNQPVHQLRMYLGEKAGLYFGFLVHYTEWLMYLSIPALFVFFGMFYHNGSIGYYNVQSPTVPFFAVFVCIWAVLMLEGWKGKQATYALEWGMAGFEDQEQDRPEFFGEVQWSPENGEKITFYPQEKRSAASNRSSLIISMMLLLVLACVGGIFTLKVVLVPYATLESTVPSIVQAVVIQVLNAIYKDMAVNMTVNENHQTDTQYEDSLVGKLYLFTFVNSYSALFFMAFVQGSTSLGCEKGSCMNDLAYTMVVLFMTNLIVGNAVEIITPIMNARARAAEEAAEETENGDKRMSVAELQYTLESYDPMESSIEDFTTISIELGYVVLFASAFPLAPVMACVSEFCQIRTDGYKLCRLFKRADPIGAEDIGIWEKIFSLTTYAAVLSNAGISMFVMTEEAMFENMQYSTRIWLFIIFQYVLVGLMTALDEAIDDVPEDVIIQQARSEFFEESIISEKDPEDDAIDFTNYAAQHKPAGDVTFLDRTHDSHYHETLEGSVFMD